MSVIYTDRLHPPFINSLRKVVLATVSATVLVGCAQRQVVSPIPQSGVVINNENSTEDKLSQDLSDQAVQALRTMIDSVEVSLEKGLEPQDEITKYRNERVQFWLKYFTQRDRERFQRYLDRGQQYKEVVQTTLEENGIPNELYYMAMIESGYVNHAYSRASAVGAWQFIRATGRRYGLRANYYVDERRDPIMATEAAVKYLRDLYNAFLSWELSMAAYNTGELRVLRAIMDGKTRDYWSMSIQKRIPKETRNYVPKFIAATLIGRNPGKYGFEDPAQKSVEPYPSVIAVEVPSSVRLRDIAKLSKVQYEKLAQVNPHLRRGVTPPYKKKYEIWVPEQYVGLIKGAYSALQAKRLKLSRIDDENYGHYHIVRRGENLSVIAKRYRMSVRNLKRVNNLRSTRIFPGMKLRTSAKAYYRPKSGGNSYQVRAGDTLGHIAKRYNTTVGAIRRVNNIRGNSIKVGQNLIIPNHARLQGRYQVRKGDTMGAIARRHGLTVKQLKSMNGITRNKVFAGEWLSISRKGI